MKIKLKDLTLEQNKTWLAVNCDYTKCVNCPFRKVRCDFLSKNSWINNKDLHSDKFLNQKVEIEIELLTKEEKEYLEGVIKPFKEVIDFIKKINSINRSVQFIHIKLCNGEVINLPYFNVNEYYKNLEVDKQYTIEDLGLFNLER